MLRMSMLRNYMAIATLIVGNVLFAMEESSPGGSLPKRRPVFTRVQGQAWLDVSSNAALIEALSQAMHRVIQQDGVCTLQVKDTRVPLVSPLTLSRAAVDGASALADGKSATEAGKTALQSGLYSEVIAAAGIVTSKALNYVGKAANWLGITYFDGFREKHTDISHATWKLTSTLAHGYCTGKISTGIINL